jgi:rhodanese-related sulfurtransferase
VVEEDGMGSPINTRLVRKSPRLRPEHVEQSLLVQWAEIAARRQHPDLRWLYAVPNGGARSKATAGKLKAEGVKRGVPDLCLPVPRGRYHGLYLEMKVGANKPTSEQVVWHSALRERGYAVYVCYSFEAAQRAILDYLALSSSPAREDAAG